MLRIAPSRCVFFYPLFATPKHQLNTVKGTNLTKQLDEFLCMCTNIPAIQI